MVGKGISLLDGSNENAAISLHKEFFTPSNIVSLLEKYKVSKGLDVLSVDTDYDDLYVLREILLAGFTPRVLIAEYNRNFGHEWSVSALAKPIGKEGQPEYWWKGDCYFGVSYQALVKLAIAFGYTPVFANGVNIVFVRIVMAKALGLLIPHVDNFPGPLEQALHRPCSNRSWAVIEESSAKLATDPSVTHADFVKSLSHVTLVMEEHRGKRGEGWRTFHAVE